MRSIDQIESQTAKLYRRLYTDNEIGQLKIASSLWFAEGLNVKEAFLEQTARNYYAGSYRADFSSGEAAQRMAKWVSDNTGGLLGGDPAALQSDPMTLMSILNTVYFHDEWVDRFNADRTAEDTFYLADGSTVRCDFLNSRYSSHGYAHGDGYTRSSLSFKNGSRMVFVLPHEGVTPESILSDPDRLRAALTGEGAQESGGMGEVVFQIPKFDFSTDLDLTALARELGIERAFSADAEFDNLLDGPQLLEYPLSVGSMRQQTSIAIDENGCEAAAFTRIDYTSAAMPEGRADMILNRPFLFAVTGIDDVPLFIGVVNNPILQ